ncbi:hypothetical protein JZO86_09470 [Enterococcus ureasiticus]|uniref:hypothetical protein n=1 Tax=Enterococcus ureasiticus TaxID=903984 RepID=UPI001A903F17|nr:hypothetical protein [Enterococcus ureasiticus]MBO0473929.1 hypothetical protein [Enterococcus ureasiticus]
MREILDELKKIKLNPDIQQVLFEVLDISTEITKLDAALVIGSIAKNLYIDGISDIDILLLTSGLEKEIIDTYKERGINFIKNDDIYTCEKVSSLNICVRNTNDFIGHISSIILGEYIEGIQKDWAIGGANEEVLLCDLSQALVCMDKSGQVKNLIKNLNGSYFIKYKKNVLDKLKKGFNQKRELTMMNYQNQILFLQGFLECIVLLSRIDCLESNNYNPGFKHLVRDDSSFLEKYNIEECNKTKWDNEFLIDRLKKITV